jgi:hypothetical protein
MLNGASPLKSNQGTTVRYKKPHPNPSPREKELEAGSF